MPASRSVWSRIRKGRLVQVLAVYLGASWLLIQITDALMTALSLPAWVGPVVVLLLAVGLLVVLATAWVQANPLVADRATTDEVPAPWAVDVRDLGRAVRGGRVPHLTWARALAGGVVAFSLLFGLAGAYVLITGRAPGTAPLAASASAAPGVAVLPFDARGLDDELWSAGMVDLLTTNLDGVGGLRAIDSRTVLARWREARAESGGDLAATLRIAASAGAHWAVVGNAVGVGDRVRISARLYDVATGAEHGSARVEGEPGGVLTLVDELSIALVRDLLRDQQLPQGPARSLAAITTSSVPALRAYLRGEAANRMADFQSAIEAYEAALAADSTFALAAHRIATAYGWIESRGSEASTRYRTLADAMSDRLPARDAALLRASSRALTDGDPAGIETLDRLARTYPDDAEIWTMLGEARFHLGPMALIPPSEALAAFETAIALDSSYAPAYIHPIELKLGTGRDAEDAARLIEAFARYGAPDRDRVRAMRLAYALTYGSDTPPSVDTLDAGTLGHTTGTLRRGGSGSLLALQQLFHLLERGPPGTLPPDIIRGANGMLTAMVGRIETFADLWPRLPGWARVSGASLILAEYGGTLPAPLLREAIAVDTTAVAPDVFNAGVVAVHLGDRAATIALLAELRRRGNTEAAEARFATLAAEVLDALELWRRGNDRQAAAELERLRHETIGFGELQGLNNWIRLWIGGIEADRDRHEDALRYLATVEFSIQARLLMAESYEALGRADSAAVAYDDVLKIWAGADPGFEPAERARRGLARVLAEP